MPPIYYKAKYRLPEDSGSWLFYRFRGIRVHRCIFSSRHIGNYSNKVKYDCEIIKIFLKHLMFNKNIVCLYRN